MLTFLKYWKNIQASISHLARILFKNEREIKTFSDEKKLREFVASRTILKKWLLEVETERQWQKKESWTSGRKEEQEKEQKYG